MDSESRALLSWSLNFPIVELLKMVRWGGVTFLIEELTRNS